MIYSEHDNACGGSRGRTRIAQCDQLSVPTGVVLRPCNDDTEVVFATVTSGKHAGRRGYIRTSAYGDCIVDTNS